MSRSDRQPRLPAESGASACLSEGRRQAQAGMSILSARGWRLALDVNRVPPGGCHRPHVGFKNASQPPPRTGVAVATIVAKCATRCRLQHIHPRPLISSCKLL